MKSITENSSCILIQWGLPEQPNGNISFYIVSSRGGSTQTSIPSGIFFYCLGGSPGELVTFTIHARISDPFIDGNSTEDQETLNTTVPFPEAELFESSIGTLTINFPPASLYPDIGEIT